MDHDYLDSAGEEELMDSGGEHEDDKVGCCLIAYNPNNNNITRTMLLCFHQSDSESSLGLLE